MQLSIDDERLERRLRVRADANKRSVEDEALHILQTTLVPEGDPSPRKNLAQAIRDRFEPLGGVELDLDWLRRQPDREPPTFD